MESYSSIRQQKQGNGPRGSELGGDSLVKDKLGKNDGERKKPNVLLNQPNNQGGLSPIYKQI